MGSYELSVLDVEEDGDFLRRRATVPPEEYQGDNYPSLEPVIAYLHAKDNSEENPETVDFAVVSPESVTIARDPMDEWKLGNFQWRFGYKVDVIEDDYSRVQIFYRPGEDYEVHENSLKQPWKNIIHTLEDRSTEYWEQAIDRRIKDA